MSILKIYQGQILQAALSEIVSPVHINYAAVDQPEPDLLAALTDLQALVSDMAVEITPEAALEADQLTVRGEHGPKLIFIGAPLGTELAALVSAVIVAGRGQSGLTPETKKILAGLSAAAHLQVFTTPT